MLWLRRDTRPDRVTVNYVFLLLSRSHCPLLSLRVGEASCASTQQQHRRQADADDEGGTFFTEGGSPIDCVTLKRQQE